VVTSTTPWRRLVARGSSSVRYAEIGKVFSGLCVMQQRTLLHHIYVALSNGSR
jgi:hypothetical protein